MQRPPASIAYYYSGQQCPVVVCCKLRLEKIHQIDILIISSSSSSSSFQKLFQTIVSSSFFFLSFPLCCWPTSRRRLFTHTGKGTRENTVDDFRRQLQSGKMGLGQLPTAGRINSIGGFFLLFFQTCRTKWKVASFKKLQIDSIRMWNKSNLARLKTFAKTRKR